MSLGRCLALGDARRDDAPAQRMLVASRSCYARGTNSLALGPRAAYSILGKVASGSFAGSPFPEVLKAATELLIFRGEKTRGF